MKRRCSSRMPVAVVQKLGADGDLRQGSLRTAANTSVERGQTGIVGFKTVVLRLRVSSSGRRFDVPTTRFFLEDRQPYLDAREETHKHNPSWSFVHIEHDRLVRHRRPL